MRFIIAIAITQIICAQEQSGDPAELYGEGFNLYKEGRYIEALKTFDRVPDTFDDKAALYAMKASCYYALERPTKALECCALAEQNNPDEDVKALISDIKQRCLAILGRSSTADKTTGDSEPEKVKCSLSFSPVFDSNPLAVSRENSQNIGGRKFKPHDYGIQSNLAMNISPWPNEDVKVLIQMGISHLIYSKNEELDTLAIPINASAAIHASDKWIVTPSVGTMITYLDGQLFEVRHGPGISAKHLWTDAISTTFGAKLTLTSANDPFTAETPALDRNGYSTSYYIDQRFGFGFLNGTWCLGAKVGIIREITLGTEYDANWLMTSIYLQSGKIAKLATLSASIGRNEGDYLNDSIFSGFAAKNRSTIYAASTQVLVEIIKHAAISVGYQWTDAISNIDVFDYRRGFMFLGMTLNFS